MSQPRKPLQEDKNLRIMWGLSTLFFVIEVINLFYINYIQNKISTNSIQLSSVNMFIEVQLIINIIASVLVLLVMNIVNKITKNCRKSYTQ